MSARSKKSVLSAFVEDDWPTLLCPRCRTGVLQPRAKQIVQTIDPESSAHRHDPDWEPEWIWGVFHGTVVCSDAQCYGQVAVIGEYHVVEQSHGREQYATELKLRAAWPGPGLTRLPEDVPEELVTRFLEAEALAVSDPASAVARLRTAIERTLDLRRVKKTYRTSAGKRKHYSLHARLDLFKAAKPEAAELLLAVKWIGNEGAHDGMPPTYEEVQTGAKLLVGAWASLYDRSSMDLLRTAKKVNSRRGLGKRR